MAPDKDKLIELTEAKVSVNPVFIMRLEADKVGRPSRNVIRILVPLTVSTEIIEDEGNSMSILETSISGEGGQALNVLISGADALRP